MSTPEAQLLRRLEKALTDDDRTHELGTTLHPAGDRIIAQGEVASEERRQAVLQVLREQEPGLRVADQLTISAASLDKPTGHEDVSG